jgi:hypothetical protein
VLLDGPRKMLLNVNLPRLSAVRVVVVVPNKGREAPDVLKAVIVSVFVDVVETSPLTSIVSTVSAGSALPGAAWRVHDVRPEYVILAATAGRDAKEKTSPPTEFGKGVYDCFVMSIATQTRMLRATTVKLSAVTRTKFTDPLTMRRPLTDESVWRPEYTAVVVMRSPEAGTTQVVAVVRKIRVTDVTSPESWRPSVSAFLGKTAPTEKDGGA